MAEVVNEGLENGEGVLEDLLVCLPEQFEAGLGGIVVCVGCQQG